MGNKFVVGQRYEVRHCGWLKSLKVIARGKRSVRVAFGPSEVETYRVKVNPYGEEESADVEYINIGQGSTMENFVTALDEI